MILTPEIEGFLKKLRKSIEADTFVKLTLSKIVDKSNDLNNVYIRSIQLKGVQHLSFTMRYQTRDEVKNHLVETGIAILSMWLGQTVRNANLMTTEADHILTFNKRGRVRFFSTKASFETLPPKDHDRSKKREIVPQENVYLRALGITSAEGKVLKDGQRKFKQINKYIEILSGLVQDNFEKENLNILDVGSGKGYLTL